MPKDVRTDGQPPGSMTVVDKTAEAPEQLIAAAAAASSEARLVREDEGLPAHSLKTPCSGVITPTAPTPEPLTALADIREPKKLAGDFDMVKPAPVKSLLTSFAERFLAAGRPAPDTVNIKTPDTAHLLDSADCAAHDELAIGRLHMGPELENVGGLAVSADNPPDTMRGSTALPAQAGGMIGPTRLTSPAPAGTIAMQLSPSSQPSMRLRPAHVSKEAALIGTPVSSAIRQAAGHILKNSKRSGGRTLGTESTGRYADNSAALFVSQLPAETKSDLKLSLSTTPRQSSRPSNAAALHRHEQEAVSPSDVPLAKVGKRMKVFHEEIQDKRPNTGGPGIDMIDLTPSSTIDLS